MAVGVVPVANHTAINRTAPKDPRLNHFTNRSISLFCPFVWVMQALTLTAAKSDGQTALVIGILC